MLDTAAATKIQNVLSALNRALANHKIDDALELFTDDCYWRDLLSFTWNIKTVEGKPAIRDMLEQRLADVAPADWTVDAEEHAAHVDGITEGFFTFDTAAARGPRLHTPQGRAGLDPAYRDA